MPLLREQVASRVRPPRAGSLDPMTAVAQGAALFAMTVGLQAQGEPAAPPTTGPRVWLQHPAVTADLAPFVVGRVLDPAGLVGVRVEREDKSWTTGTEALDKENTFAMPLALRPRTANDFRLFAVQSSGAEVPLSPPTFRIIHGLTIGDPPLARTVGVARADNSVMPFVERGVPLPMRRTFTLHTVAPVSPNAPGFALLVPIVQGEFLLAHLCRLVGTISLEAGALKGPLPAGSAVDITIELDRGGRLTARALIPALSQTFDHVAQLVVASLSLDALGTTLDELSARLRTAQGQAFRDGAHSTIAALGAAHERVADAATQLDVARGGDADAGEMARRVLIEVDAELAEFEAERGWPLAVDDAHRTLSWAASWMGRYGDEAERKLFATSFARAEQWIKAKKPLELAREVRVADRLGSACYFRDSHNCGWELEYAASRISEASDPVAAQAAINAGRTALAANDKSGFHAALHKVRDLLPPDVDDQRLGHDSGVR